MAKKTKTDTVNEADITELVVNMARQRLDAWDNVASGFGGKLDKRKGFSFNFGQLQESIRWNLYARQKLMTKIIDIVPDTALKKPIDFENEYEHDLKDFYKDLKVYSNLKTLWKYAKVSCGAIWILNIDDGQEEQFPVNYKNIKSVKADMIVPKEYLIPDNLFDAKDSITMKVVSYGKDNVRRIIHKDRYLFIDGFDTGYTERINNSGFGGSDIDVFWEDVRDYYVAHQIPNVLLIDFAQGVYKLKDMNMKMSSPKGQSELKSKMDLMALMASTINAKVMDQEDDYDRKQSPVNGLDILIMQPERKLSAVTGIPHTLLLGESPGASLSQAGTSQKADFYDKVMTEREEILSPLIDQLNNIFAWAYLKKDIWLDWEWKALIEESEIEEADYKLKKAQTDAILIDNQIYSPQEIREMREAKKDKVAKRKLMKSISDTDQALNAVNENTPGINNTNGLEI